MPTAIVGTGREGGLSPARRRLAARYLPLALALAGPFGRSQPWLADDCRGVASLALSEATAAYGKGPASYRTYVCDRIVWALKNHRRDGFPRGYRAARARAGRPAFVPIEERSAIALPPAPAIDTREEVEALLRRLPGPHAAVIERISLRGETHREAAQALGRSPTRVGIAHREALAMLGVELVPGRHAAPHLRASSRAPHAPARPESSRPPAPAPKGE